MSSIDRTAASARLRMRGLWLASTALVGIRIVPQPVPGVPHLAGASSLLQARMARLLALAVEPLAALRARLTGGIGRRSARTRRARRLLAASVALSLVSSAALRPDDARAAGGSGGGAFSNGGAGGADSLSGTGELGGPGLVAGSGRGSMGGGGGGGAGVSGGNGGGAIGSGAAGAGGSTGGNPSPNGGNGTDGINSGGTGGGGGAHGYVGADLPGSTATGGTGGRGGSVIGGTGGGGGGGGGGYGAIVTGTGNLGSVSVSVSITGGDGGAGGQGNSIISGGGGTGGIGLRLDDAAFTNAGTITGGTGGAAGAGPGSTPGLPGASGAGILGANLTITNTGTIAGGGNGAADAITFTSGTNVLTYGGTITGNLAIQTGTLRIDAAAGGSTVANTVTGAGGLIQNSANTLTLSGTNTYTGGTTVSAGTLRIGAGGTTGAILGDVTNDASLIFDRSNAYTFAGAISGSGSLTQAGVGTLTLSGANTYTGATAIAGGTLQIGSGATGSLAAASDVTVAGGATLALARTGTLNFGNAVSGAGRLTVQGATGASDLITLSGALRQTGGFIVSNPAKVTLTGSYIANVAGDGIVLNGGTFTNQGTITATGTAGTNGILTSATADTRVVNEAGARIEAQASGVIQNTGSNAPGALTVDNNGLIQGNNYDGVTQHGTGALTVTNSGVIYGRNAIGSANGYAVGSDGTGRLTLTNSAGGTIVGQYGAVGSNAGDRITNAGTIAAGSYSAGTVTPGGIAGIDLRGGGTIVNQAGGRIAGATAIRLNTVGAATVTLDQGSTVDGQILSQNAGARTLTVNGALNGAYNGTFGSGVVNFTLGATGTMQGATFGVASDTFTYRGGTVGGTINAGAGTDALVSALGTGGTGTLNQGNLTGFESYAQQSGTLTLTGTNTSNVRWDLQGGALNVAGTLSTAGTAVTGSDGTILRVASGGLITNTSGITIGGGGTFTIVNAGTIRNTGDGSDVINNGATLTLLNTGTVSNVVNVAAGANGAGSRITNARGASLTGGSGTQYGIGASLGDGGRIDNYGTISGGATLAGGGGTLSGSTGITANLYAGSSTGTVRLGASSTLSLYTGTGTNNTVGVTTTDPVTGATVVLQNAGTNAAATVGGISLGTGGVIALRGIGDGSSTNGVAGALNMSNVASATTLNKQDSGTFLLTGSYGAALSTTVTGGRLVAQNTGGAFGTSGSVAINSGAVVELSNTTANSVIEQPGISFTGAGTLEKTGAGIVSIGGNAASSVALSQGATVDVVAGTLRGSTQSRGNWSSNSAGLTIRSGATFDGVDGNIRVDGLNGAGTLQGGASILIGTAGGGGVFTGTIQNSLFAGGTLSLTKLGAGTQTLSGTSTYSGGTTISQGSLKGGATDSFSANSAFTVNSGTVLDLGGFGNTIGSLAGTGTVTNSGSAAATLTAGGNGATTSFSGLIRNGANATVGLTKTGTGTLTLTGANTYTGGTTVSAGRLVASKTVASTNDSPLGASGTVRITAGATVELSTTNTGITAGFNGLTFRGAGTLEKTGAGSAVFGQFSTPSAIAMDSGGRIDVKGGTLFGSSNFQGAWSGNSASLDIAAGATFNGVEADIRVDALTGAGTLTGGFGSNAAPVGTTTIGVAGGSGTFSGTIRDFDGTMILIKAGAGTQTLSGTNTYTGTTTISGGTLIVASATALGGTAAGTSVANGANLRIAGVAVGAESVALNGGTALTGTGTASLAGAVSLGATSTVTAVTGAGLTLSGVVSGAGLTKAGGGSLTLSGSNTYTGTTTISGGSLALTGAGSVAGSAGVVVGSGTSFDISGVTGAGTAITTLSGAGSVALGARTLSLSNAASSFSGAIGGSGGLTLNGGSQTLSGINTYAGTTTVTAGTLGLSGGQALADSGAVLVNGGTLSLATSETVGSLGGTGGRVAIGAGQALTAGGTDAGTSFAGTLTTADAAGVFNKTGTGTLTLTGANGTGAQFTGTANVTAGTLSVNGTFGDTVGRAATVNVGTGGTLHGSGTIAGSVNVNGGTVSAGNSPGTLTVGGDYTLNAASTSLFEMGAAGKVGGPAGEATSNDLINVGGSLTLAGTLQLVDTASPANPIVSGYYRLFNYNQNNAGGTVTGDFGTVSVASGSTAEVYKNVPSQVNVLVTNGAQAVQFWDGTDATGTTAGPEGGAGIWSTANTNWTTNPDGQVNDRWRSNVGVFAGAARGAVTVDGVQSFQGLQFATTGYTLTEGSLNLGGNAFNAADSNSFINVDAGVSATIASTLTGSAGLTKLGGGTLTLSGDNGYGGGTVFAAGILEAASANALGTGGTLSFTGGTLRYGGENATDYSARFSTAANQAYRVDTNGRDVGFATGLTSSNGSLTKLGTGTLTLTGASTYTGATTISGGTLQIGDGGTTGTLAAASAVTLENFATLALNRSGTLAFDSDVSGEGRLTVQGATGADDGITLSGALRQTGGFTVADASNVTLSGSYAAGNAIVLSGGGTFTNRGGINVSADAIFTSTNADTTVVNAAGARIVGGNSGVIQIQDGAAGALTVTNSGLIQGIDYDGVTQHGTGALTVTNTGTGVIYGQNRIGSDNGYGVGSDGTGVLTLTNQAGGRIVGQYGAVGSNANDRITNAGTIASGSYDAETGTITAGGIAGVELRAGGTVVNQAGGVIQGGGNAIRSNGALVLQNAGTIASPTSDGILTFSTIDIRNAGTVSSSVNSGIAAVSGRGGIVNATGGAFTGGSSAQFGYGVQFAGGSGTVDNYGTLNSTRAAADGGSGGIYAYDRNEEDLATVTANLHAGSTTGRITLSGGNDTVALYTGTGTANAGLVTGGGVRLQNAGTLAAAAFGTIDLGGGANTVALRGAGDGTAANGVAGTLDLGAVSGAGTFEKLDGGTWTLTGQSAAPLAGTTANIRGGILAINGTFGDAEANDAAVNVEAGGTLHGSGTVAGSVVVNGGTVSAGNSPGTLTVARDYTLNAGSTSLFELGAPGVPGGESNDLIAVGRNLQLGGALSLVSAADAATAPVSGAYRLFNYGGALSGAFDSVSTPTAGSTALVYTDIPNQVNVLLVNGNQSVQYWDGADTTGAGIGGEGGAGTWSAAGSNWTTLPGGRVNDAWRSGVGIFGGTAGAVTVAGAQNVQGLQFTVDGYSLGGTGTLNLTGDPATTPAQSFVNVDRGVGVTIANALTSTGGSFGLRKIGDGTLTLTGASTYAGATTVEAGTLAIAAGGSVVSAVTNRAVFTNAGTLSGGLTNTGTVSASAGRIDGAIANNAGTFTVSGSVASDGRFTNAGGATLAVTGSGAYGLGGLLTNAGSLTVASGGSLTAPAGIVNSGSIRVAQGGTITDALANIGSVVNDGAYNADVSNSGSGTIANTATGVWTGNLTTNTSGVANAGQWRGDGRNDAGGSVTNTGTWITATGPFANAGTLATSGVLVGGLANTGTVQASGQIVGAVSNGAGASFALTGALSGVTAFANDGTLDLGGTAFTVGSLSGSATAAVVRNGALTTGGGNGSTAYAGSIVDGAVATSLTKTGSGSLTLTGTNTYTGGTTINAGTVVAAASALGRGPVTNNADLIVDQPSDATLGSAVDGTGRFVKRGAGALTYTGTGTLSGATTVEAGRLSVDGSLGNSVVTVANAATLGGSGTVGGVVATAGSAVAPGSSPGTVDTLRVAGNVLFASRSLYQVDATAAGQADRIAATGTATLQGGTVQVTAQAGLYSPTTSYTILSAAGGVTGRFAGVTSNFAYLTPFLTYGANEATLRLARNDLQFAATAQTRNQGNVADAAQATGVGSRLYDAIAVLSAPQSRVAFDALSGEVHASAVTAQFENAFLVREAVLDRLRWGDTLGFGGGIGGGIGQRFAPGTTLPGAYTADLPGRAPALAAIPTRLVDPQPVAVWGQGFGSFGQTASDGNAARLARQTSGFVLGADARVENDWRLGAAGGYSFTNVDVTGRLSTGTVESGFGALYAGGPLGPRSPLQLRLGATYGGNSLTTRRAVTFAGFSESAGARYGGTTAQGFAEVGYRIGMGASYVEPFVGAAAIRIGRDGFSETGGASALTAQGRDYDLATSTVGLRAEGRLAEVFAIDLPIMVRALVGYRRAYGDVVPSALLAFAGGQQFVSAGIPIDRDALVAQAGIDWQIAPTTTLGVNYTGQVGQRAQDHGVKGNFTYRF